MAWFNEEEVKHVFMGSFMGAGAAVVRAFFSRDKKLRRFISRVLIGAVMGTLAALITMAVDLPEIVNRCIFFACGWATKEIAEKFSNLGVKSVDQKSASEDSEDE